MEFHGYDKGGLPVGFTGRIINLTDGYTDFSVGNLTGAAIDGNFGGGVFRNNLLYGWCFGASPTKRFYTYSYGLKSGVAMTRPLFQTQNKIDLPGLVNTNAPQPFYSSNNPMYDNGVYTSAENALINWSFIVYPNGGIASATPAPDLGVSSFKRMGNGIYTNNKSFAELYPLALGDREKLLETDYLTYAAHYFITWVNPPGGANIDDYMINHAITNGHITSYGWLEIFPNTITVEGQICNGFGVLSSPDMTSYKVLRIVPIDAHSQNWTTEGGDYDARVDSSGALWMKNVNKDAELYVSAGSVLEQLPIYPPTPIPDHGDTDPVLKLFRSK